MGEPLGSIVASAGLPSVPSGAVLSVVLVASVLHALWNAIAKSMKDQVVAFGLIALAATVSGGCMLLVVRAPSGASAPFLAGSVAVHLAYNVALLNSYRFGDLGEVYPLARGIAPLLVAGGAALVAGERLAPAQLVGIAVVAGGLTSLVWSRRVRSLRDRHALWLAVAAGVAIALYSVVDGLGVRRAASPLGYAGALFLAEGFATLVGISWVRRRDLARGLDRSFVLGLFGGVLSVVAYALVLFAQTKVALATVSALRETSVVVAALIGTVVLHEGSGRRRVLSALVVAAGVALLVAA